MQEQKYSLSMRLMHWTMALLIIFMLGLGFYMTNFLTRESPNRMEVYDLHKSFGALVLILVAFRIFLRIIKTVPTLPDTMDNVTQALAHLGHLSLYILMIAMPLSGYLMSSFFGFPVHMFGIAMPHLVSVNPELGKICAEAHEIFGIAFVAVLVAHVGAVIKHKFFDRPENDILNRML